MTQQRALQIGDKVRRKRGRQVVGTIKRIIPAGEAWGRKHPDRAYVQWHKSFARFGGGYTDQHSTLALSALERVEEVQG